MNIYLFFMIGYVLMCDLKLKFLHKGIILFLNIQKNSLLCHKSCRQTIWMYDLRVDLCQKTLSKCFLCLSDALC